MHTVNVAAAIEAIAATVLIVGLFFGVVGMIRDERHANRKRRALTAYTASPEYLAARAASRAAWDAVQSNRNAQGHARCSDVDAYQAAVKHRETLMGRHYAAQRAA